MLPGLAPCVAQSPPPPFDVSYVGLRNVSFISSATITQTGVDIGAADGTRLVILPIHYQRSGGATFINVAIGGVSATILQTSGSNVGVALAWAKVPTGTTATVVITTDAQLGFCRFGVIRMVGQSSDTPSSTSNPTGGGDSTRTATLMRVSGGASIVAATGTSTNDITGVTMAYTYTGGGTEVGQAGISFPTAAGSASYSTSTRSIVGAHWS